MCVRACVRVAGVELRRQSCQRIINRAKERERERERGEIGHAMRSRRTPCIHADGMGTLVVRRKGVGRRRKEEKRTTEKTRYRGRKNTENTFKSEIDFTHLEALPLDTVGKRRKSRRATMLIIRRTTQQAHPYMYANKTQYNTTENVWVGEEY